MTTSESVAGVEKPVNWLASSEYWERKREAWSCMLVAELSGVNNGVIGAVALLTSRLCSVIGQLLAPLLRHLLASIRASGICFHPGRWVRDSAKSLVAAREVRV